MKSFFKKYTAIVYMIASLIWIGFSDYYINKMDQSSALFEYIQIGKGLLFVIFTTILIHIIVKKHEQYKRVEEKESELSTLINSMPDFVNFKDAQGRWIRVNEFGKELYELGNIDYIGKTDIDLGQEVPFFKDAFEYCYYSDKETWEKGVLTRGEESFFIPSGDQKTFDVIKVPLFSESGKRKGLLTIGRDITQQKMAENMLIRKEKLSVVGELAAGIAHEIRNPLTSIKGFVQLMKESNDTPKEHYDIILVELERINQIVSEMLVLSKPQSKLFKPFHVNELIDYATKLTSHEAILHGINLSVHNETKNQLIFGDINQLIQVFINIIKNSIDAMPNGGNISIFVEQLSDTLKISIKDTGVGIPDERLVKIGEPFFTLKEKGMGLGLTISNKILQEHKGHMEIESEVGKGTLVEIYIPIYSDNL